MRIARSQLGFTLIEVVISSALMAMIIVSAYLCLSASISGRRLTEPRLEVIQNARVAMALMSADLRSACPLDKDSELVGMQRKLGDIEADNLDFATHNYTPRHPREGDFCEESLYLGTDPETGQVSLYRRRNPTIAPDPFSGGSKEEIARGVLGLRFEYYDGLDWYGEWGNVEGKAQYSNRQRANSSGMPEAVRITLWLDANPRAKPVQLTAAAETNIEPPFVFQTVVRLNLASAATSGSSSGSSGTTTSGSSGQAAPAAAPGGGN